MQGYTQEGCIVHEVNFDTVILAGRSQEVVLTLRSPWMTEEKKEQSLHLADQIGRFMNQDLRGEQAADFSIKCFQQQSIGPRGKEMKSAQILMLLTIFIIN